MVLIHTALYPEAKPIIEHFKLKQFQTQPYKIYKDEKIILVVSGIGKVKTTDVLEDICSKHKFDKAINIGICGCKDESIEIGTFFDVTKQDILTTLDEPLEDKARLETLLVDMEAKYFKYVVNKYIDKKEVYIYKIVSDHLNKTIPKKSFVNTIIKDSIKYWENVI